MTAVAEQTGAWLDAVHQSTARAAAVAAAACARPRLQRFAELGFPTTHDEEWRFTNVAPIARTRISAALATDGLLSMPFPSGRAGAERTAEAIWRTTPLFDQNAFVALNTAFLDHVTAPSSGPRGAVIEQPIEITYEVPAARTRLPRSTRAP